MEENKNIEPQKPSQNTTEEINSTLVNFLPEAATAATGQPQTSNLKPKLPLWKSTTTVTYTKKRNGKNIFFNSLCYSLRYSVDF
ncbi:MAG: hypothetical protein ABIO81_11585 [Ginsengibacter sp.]